MNHNSQDELLSAYLDGELTADEQAVVEKRLSESAELRQLYDDLRALRVSFESFPTYRLPHDLSQQVLRRAERAMLNSPDVTNPNLAAASSAASPQPVKNPVLEATVAGKTGAETNGAEKTVAEKTVSLAPLGGLRFPRGLRPWLWAAASIAAAVLMMVNAERPDNRKERDVAMVSESQKQPADAVLSAAPPRGALGKKADATDNSIDSVETESFAVDHRAKQSNRFAEGLAVEEEAHLAKGLRQSKADDGALVDGALGDGALGDDALGDDALGDRQKVGVGQLGEGDLADESLDTLKLNERMTADEYVTKRESATYSKQPADFSRSTAEGLATRTRRTLGAEQQGMLGGRQPAGAGGFGGGFGGSEAEAKTALGANDSRQARQMLGYTAVETEQLAQRLLSTTVLPQGVDRDDVAVVELQITPAAAQSGAFYRLLHQNHIAFTAAPAQHAGLIKEAAEYDRIGSRTLGKASGAVAGETTDGRNSEETRSGLALDAAEKSARAKDGSGATMDRQSGNDKDAGHEKESGQVKVAGKIAADNPRAGNKGLASDKLANDKLANDRPANERTPALDRRLGPRGFAADDNKPRDQEMLQELEAASKQRSGRDPAYRFDTNDDASQVVAGEAAKQSAVKLKTAESLQNFDDKARSGKAQLDAFAADAKLAKSKDRDTSDMDRQVDAADMDGDGLGDRAETAGVASNWMFGSMSDASAAAVNLAAVLVEADVADLNSTLAQLHAQSNEFVELAVHPGESREALNFYFEQSPELLGRLSRRGEQSAGDVAPEFGVPAPVRAEQDAEKPAPLPADGPSREGAPSTLKQYSNGSMPADAAKRYAKRAPAPPAKQDSKAELGTEYVRKTPATERPLLERNLAEKPSAQHSLNKQETDKLARDKQSPDKRVLDTRLADKKLADTNLSDRNLSDRRFRAPQPAAQDRAGQQPAAANQLASDDFIPPHPADDAPAAAPKTEPATPVVADDRLEQPMRGRAIMLPITPDLLAFQQSLSHDLTTPEDAVDQPVSVDSSLGVPFSKDTVPGGSAAKSPLPVAGQADAPGPVNQPAPAAAADARQHGLARKDAAQKDAAQKDAAQIDAAPSGVAQKAEPLAPSAAGVPAASTPTAATPTAPKASTVQTVPPAASGPLGGQGAAPLSGTLAPQAPAPPVAKAPSGAKGSTLRRAPGQAPVAARPRPTNPGASPGGGQQAQLRPKPDLEKAAEQAPTDATKSQPSVDNASAPPSAQPPTPALVAKEGNAQPQQQQKQLPESIMRQQAAPAQPQIVLPRQRESIRQRPGDSQLFAPVDDEQAEKQPAPAKKPDVEFGDATVALADGSIRQPRYVLFLVRVVDPSTLPVVGQEAGEVTAESKPAESKPAESKPAESKPAESKPAESKPAEAASEVEPTDPQPPASRPAAPNPASPAQQKLTPARPAPAKSPRR